MICSFFRPFIFDLWLIDRVLDFSGVYFLSILVLFWLDQRAIFYNFFYEHGEIVLEIHLNRFLNVSVVYDQSFYAFFGFPFYAGSGNSRWLLLIE